MSRKGTIVALLLLNPWVMPSISLNNACVVQWPLLKPYWSFLFKFNSLTLEEDLAELHVNTQSVPRSKHTPSQL